MHLSSPITFLRDIGRHRALEIEVHTVVSGEVTPGCDHPDCDCLYTVVLDQGLDLWTTEEMEKADTVLGEAFLAASLPYALVAA